MFMFYYSVKLVTCNHCLSRPQAAYGEVGHQTWKTPVVSDIRKCVVLKIEGWA